MKSIVGNTFKRSVTRITVKPSVARPSTRITPLVFAQSGAPQNPLRAALTSVVSAISEAGAKSTPSNPNMSALWNGIMRSDAEAVEAAIKAGADVNEKNAEGETPLLFIARAGHYKYPPAKIPTMLIKAGADKEVKGKDGYTALEKSLKSGWQNIAYLLLESGASTAGVAAIKNSLTCPDCREAVRRYNL